jgi:hypothetical protein
MRFAKMPPRIDKIGFDIKAAFGDIDNDLCIAPAEYCA